MPNDSAVLVGEFRQPRQMLADQKYGGHQSLHDDDMAEALGFSAGPIEGPTHFSQFVPLCCEFFGDEPWLTRGCISSHYQNMVFEGEEVRCQLEPVSDTYARISAEKRDGTPVLTGTASIGPHYGQTELEERRGRLRPADQLVILSDMHVGQKGAGNPEPVIMDFDQHMGDLYPFSLNDKLQVITETHPAYSEASAGDFPWRRPIIPLEMISVLCHYTNENRFRPRGPAVGLFAGLEIRLIDGPLFVNHPYYLEREIIALSESKRTESAWVKTSVFDTLRSEQPGKLVAEVVLNSATLKDSYARYEEDARTLGKSLS